MHNRDINHLIPGKKGDASADLQHVTLILKTLYIRYLVEGGLFTRERPEKRDAELLVTCSLKNESNAREKVYPVIFEKGYAPGFVVNRRDRIIYGPAPYQGEFMDLRMTVLELDSLNNTAINAGFSNLVSAIGRVNPEMAVVSPALTAMFSTILATLTQDDKELDASFTFPGSIGNKKAEVDSLVTETGHYVIIKQENPNRKEKGINRSAKSMLYRRLILNLEDNRLYWRKYYSDPKANFIRRTT